MAKNALDLTALLGGKDFPTFDLGMLKTRLAQALKAGQELAAEANRVMIGWALTVAPGFTALQGVLSDSLSIAKDALDLTSTLGGEKFPDLGDGVLAILKARLARLLVVGQELAVVANTAMTGWSLTVAPGFAALKGVLSDSLAIAKDALDVVGTLGGEKFPDLGAGALELLKTRLDQLIKAGQQLAVQANWAMTGWTLQVALGFGALKGVLSDSLSIAKDALDAVGVLSGKDFPDLSAGPLALMKTRLDQLVRAGGDLAQAAPDRQARLADIAFQHITQDRGLPNAIASTLAEDGAPAAIEGEAGNRL